jgi:hypothetical protein
VYLPSLFNLRYAVLCDQLDCGTIFEIPHEQCLKPLHYWAQEEFNDCNQQNILEFPFDPPDEVIFQITQQLLNIHFSVSILF